MQKGERRKRRRQNHALLAAIYAKYDTYDDLADDLGYADGSTVSRVVLGRRTLSPTQMEAWAKQLDCDPKDLFPDYEEKHVPATA